MALTDYDAYQGLHPIEAIDQAITDIDTVKTYIPSGASAQNKLVTESDIETVETDIEAKQDELTTAQLAAVNSGVTAAIVEEIEDARTGADGTEYLDVKSRLDAENAMLEEKIEHTNSDVDEIKRRIGNTIISLSSDELESGYYSSIDGTKQSSSSFVRSKTLYAIDGGFFYKSDSENQVRACLYAADMSFITHIYLEPSGTSVKRTIVPANAKYCGLFVPATESSIRIAKLDSSGVNGYHYPFDMSRVDYVANRWINGYGEIEASQSMNLLSLFNLENGAKYYVSNSSTYNCICFDASGNVLSTTYETVAPAGKIYTIPVGTVVAYFNLDSTSDYVDRTATTASTEVFEARTGADNVKYQSLKARIDAENAALTQSISANATDINKIYIEIGATSISLDSSELESGYYSSVDGSKQSSSSYIRSKNLLPIQGGFFYKSNTEVQVQACLYDKDKTFISRIYLSPAHTTSKRTIVPANARYCGLFVASSESAIKIEKLDSTGFQFAVSPYDYPGMDEAFGYWINGTGSIQASSSFILLSLYNVKPGEKYYVSNDASYNGICFDAAGNKLAVSSESVAPYGKIFTIPENAVVIYFNIYTATKTGVNEDYAEYIAKITKPQKVLCIGDSVTWLDGRGTYGGSTHLMGYQRILRQNGYDTRSAGYSGYPYAEGIHDQGETKYSIHNEIVGKEYDLSDYDIIVLVGGLNDISLSSPLGTRCTDYQPESLDVETLNGSLSSIIDYIRTTNDKAKIVLCTTLKSEDPSRTWAKSSALNDEIEYNGRFWSCYLANVFEDLNVQPFYPQFEDHFYDLTHPNWNGMGKLGAIILDAVENC